MTRIAPRATRLARLVSSVLAALGLIVGAAVLPAAAAPPPSYVALGDSIAAGTGGGAYLNQCLQTAESYPALLGASANLACYGATTSDVVAGQVPALPATARNVTITVGANDVGDRAVAFACATGPGSPACQQAIYTSVFILLPQLPAKLAATISAVKAKAPGAHITLTGYPLLFTVSGLPTAEQPVAAQINGAIALLNATIAGTSLTHGAAYADVTWRFFGHGIGSPDPWIHPFVLGDPASFHPTAAGYALGYVPSVGPFIR
ncbi:SGNH/GDSL hydrolase family protein [Sinomonas sp. ASV322]|uniref:SGNH/GDSL hydrolase family protein n=1 Tax=Sinomonas sp. ASV322 TaxID=3041920 RepID=UPI0027DD9D0B|nr:SGNH/GDSL hydrolase family protein [Sinomonas sp. ASV322]MDQ4503736.1 SGNH/GDSL hydrolase family protein [Sinomonas sp. ASV322]